MSESALKSLSKTALEKRVVSLTTKRTRERAAAEEIGGRVADVMGGGVAFATATSIGFIEGKFRNKDKTSLSLGPVPLTLTAAAVASGAALLTGSRWFSYAAAGAVGAYGYGMGLAAGEKSRAGKGRRVKGIGDEQMDDDLAEHHFGD